MIQPNKTRRFKDMIDTMKLQYFGHIIRKNNSLGKQIKLGSVEGRIMHGRLRVTSFGVRELTWNSWTLPYEIVTVDTIM